MTTYKFPKLPTEVGVVDQEKPYFHVDRYGAIPSTYGTSQLDNQSAIQRAIESAVESGGNEVLWGSGNYYISNDINSDRSINHRGVGSQISRIVSSSQRRFYLKGAPPNLEEMTTIQGLAFDKVSMEIGPTSGDIGRGVVIAFCSFVNCDHAVYYGYHTYNTKIIGSNFRLNGIHLYYDFGTVATDAGAGMMVSDCVLSECTNAVWVQGSTSDGYHLYFNNIICDNAQNFLTTRNVVYDGIISIKNISFELIHDCFIDNQGANVVVDGFMALSVAENYWVWNRSTASNAWVMFRNGRASWFGNKLVRTDGGVTIFDQPSMFMNGPMWGTGLQSFAHASSTGGKVMALRQGNLVRQGETIPTISSGSATQTISIAQGFDYNDRVIEFDVACTASGSSNTLRLQLADGVSSPFIDLVFPNVSGGARVRMVWNRGGNISASAMYSPSTAGNSAWVTASTADTTTLSATKFLAFVTTGGSPSTIVVTNVCETVSGHKVNGL